MKFFHEAPISVFDKVRDITSGDYCLANVYVENDEYKTKFLESSKLQREIILDNGVFETGTAMTGDEYVSIIKELQPTWYIIPDALEDCDKTIQQLDEFLEKYPDLPGKKIGVVQGKTYNDIVRCYNHLKDKVDMIGISFDYSLYEEWFPEEKTKYHSWMKGRRALLNAMVNNNIINNELIHLLGMSLPQEGIGYSKYGFIYSVDSSNPVVHGIKNIKYNGVLGLENKESVKLFTLINSLVSDIQYNNIIYNITMCRNIWMS